MLSFPRLLYLFSPRTAKEWILQVAHGLILRCFAKRWLGWMMHSPLPMTLLPGSVSVLRYDISYNPKYFQAQVLTQIQSYKANDINRPAFHLGMALPLPN